MSDKDPAAADNSGTADKTTQTDATTSTTATTTATEKPATLAGGGATEQTTTATTATEVADWRKQMAGDDAEAAKRLGRFADPTQVWKSYRALEQRISSGDLKKALPDNASAEELASWRKENGLPENEKGYVDAIKLPNGLIVGETDKPLVEEFAKYAHGKNWSPAQYNDGLAFYYENQDRQRAATETADANYKQQSEDALRTDWQGHDFRRNLTAVNNLIATMPEGLGESLLSARMPDGRLVGDNPAFIKYMANTALELNPAASLVPAGTTDPAKSVSARLDEIREMRRTDPTKYAANAKKFEAEEVELIDAQLKMRSRAA